MKRGRPSKRKEITSLILEQLKESRTPFTTSSLARIISKKTDSRVSWNTIQKYLREMIETNKVQAISLPHSKKEGKNGLTVYVLKQ